jgi:periplasmic divalent cation tolerance protein
LGPASEFIIVLTTFPATGDVEDFARALIAEKLAACVNILPLMQSLYFWEGTIEKSEERQMVIKTTLSRREELEARVKSLHPYETPEFLVVPVSEGSSEYLAWLRLTTTN